MPRLTGVLGRRGLTNALKGWLRCYGASGSWIADSLFTNGQTRTWTNTVSTALLTGTLPPQTVLQSARIGNFSYTFTSAEAQIGKVTFRAVANLSGARDALPADNEAVAAPTKVGR